MKRHLGMPLIGCTYKVRNADVVHSTVNAALKAGFRAIDTAEGYKNEADIATSLQKLLPVYGLTRSDIHITSKLGPHSQGSGKCREACLQSVKNLQTEYLDLYLVHWPGVTKVQPNDPANAMLRKQSWQDMEQLKEEGVFKTIGVSNYTKKHLEELLSFCKIKPSVLQASEDVHTTDFGLVVSRLPLLLTTCEHENSITNTSNLMKLQVEHHPHLVQRELVDFCRQHDIHYQAYSSLGTTTEHNELLTDPTVVNIASQYQRTPAQILLRWAYQQNIGIIPKSTNAAHIQENMDIVNFSLNEADMKTLSGLDKQLHYCWNPEKVL